MRRYVHRVREYHTPLTTDMIGVAQRHWALAGEVHEPPERLLGGEESAAYRLGRHVVRIGPAWRADAEVEWCHAVAAAAAARVAEALAPCRTATGSTVARVARRPVTVWPFVEGSRGDDRDRGQRAQAADLLARLHDALAGVRLGPRPPASAPRAEVPDLEDPELDEWLDDFDRAHESRQPLHGDFYGGNVLVREGRIVGLLDWDEAFVGPPERELAWAAWEWGDGLGTLALQGARTFIAEYAAAGGPARPIGGDCLRQLVRQRIRWEVSYARAAARRGVALDADDHEYQDRQLEAFRLLGP
ncbi:MAG: phosphotransferase enzyme family protein [Solirubrobacteraceae bacterium]